MDPSPIIENIYQSHFPEYIDDENHEVVHSTDPDVDDSEKDDWVTDSSDFEPDETTESEEEDEEVLDMKSEIDDVDNLDESFVEGSPEDESTDIETHLWKDQNEKQEWERNFQTADQQWKQKYGFSIDATACPQSPVYKKQNQEGPKKLFLSLIYIFIAISICVFDWNLLMNSQGIQSFFGVKSSTECPLNDNNEESRHFSIQEEESASIVQVAEHPDEVFICRTSIYEMLELKNEENVIKAKQICNTAVLTAKESDAVGDLVAALTARGSLNFFTNEFNLAKEDYSNALKHIETHNTVEWDSAIYAYVYKMKIQTKWLCMFLNKEYSELKENLESFLQTNFQEIELINLATQWIELLEKKEIPEESIWISFLKDMKMDAMEILDQSSYIESKEMEL